MQPLLAGMPEFPGLVVCLDRESEAIAVAADQNPESAATPEDTMYVIFTSGSTGRPKGVEVQHRAVVNLLTWMGKELTMGPGDVFPALASFAFDMSVPELYLALASGGAVLLADRHLVANGEELAALLRAQNATVVHATPTTWSLLLEAGFTGAGLKRCIGAELLPRELFGRLMRAAEGTPLYNFYGPTETTVWSTFHKFTSADETIVVGRPIANTQVYLLDESLQPVPAGVSGGIYIAGDGVTKGYFGRPELTAEKFIPNPFAAEGKLYYTGDRGRYLADGRIEYIERADNQVKLRGFRIELGEIEAVLASHPTVRECVVIAREDQPGNKFLAAYVVAQEPSTPVDTSELRAFVKQRLPDYMVPSGWLALERLPLSANGKVDRKNLPAPDALSLKASTGTVPQTPVEIRLANIWEEMLKVSSIRLDDDFFNLGGHSLLAVQMMAKAREAFGCELPLPLLFGAPRLGDLARVIQTERGKQPFKSLIPIRKTGTKPPLFCISRPNVNALGFIFLSRHLSPDQPVIGLQTQMEKDGKSWVYDQVEYEEKAREYIKILREDYPEGPYLLTGYCEGAHIAFEMARELEAMNLPVAMVAILDAWPVENTVSYTKYRIRNYLREFRKRRRKLFEKLNRVTGLLLGKRLPAAPAPVAPVTPVAPAVWVSQSAEQRKMTTEQIERRYWPGAGFVPTKYSGLLTLIRTQRQARIRINDQKMGWGQRALGGVDVISVTGDHAYLLREPYVVEVARQMQLSIDRALAAQPKAGAATSPATDLLHQTADAS
jgi:amino acid adenylation domain-containing protein